MYGRVLKEGWCVDMDCVWAVRIDVLHHLGGASGGTRPMTEGCFWLIAICMMYAANKEKNT